MGGRAVPGPLGNTALALFILLHLSAFGGRQLAHEFEISRNREIRQARLAKRNQLGFRELLAWMKDDGRHDFVLGKRRTDGKCRCIRDGRVAEQDLLDFEGRDILTTAPDGVLEAIDEPKIAIGLANDSIPGVEPAPRFGGFLRRTEISGCEGETVYSVGDPVRSAYVVAAGRLRFLRPGLESSGQTRNFRQYSRSRFHHKN